MEYQKIYYDAAESSVANFIPQGRACYLGNAIELLRALMPAKKTVIACTDGGWHLIAGRIKRELISAGVSVTALCFDDGKPFATSLERMLGEIGGDINLIAVGKEQLALAAAEIRPGLKIFYLPTDCSFGYAIKHAIEFQNITLLIDMPVFEGLKRNKILSGCESVIAKRIALVEMRVKELIDGFFVEKHVKELFVDGAMRLNEYLTGGSVKDLAVAQIKCSAALCFAKVDYAPYEMARLLDGKDELSDSGEREYLCYKMLIRLYRLFLNSDMDFLIKLPAPFADRSTLDGYAVDLPLKPVSEIPSWFASDKDMLKLKAIFTEDAALNGLVANLNGQIAITERILKRVYGGRKYTVEHYSPKKKGEAFTLSPYLVGDKCLLKLIWGMGVLEYCAENL